MATILGVIPVTDQQARDYNAADLNHRIAILQFAGLGAFVDAAIEAWMHENYGFLGSEILNNPEIRHILIVGGREGWSEAKIQGALQNTSYWKNTDAAMRQWNQLKSSDPAQYQKLYNDASTSVQAQALALLGSNLPNNAAFRQLVTKVASGSVTDAEQIRRMIVAQASYREDAPASILTSSTSSIVARAQQFGMKMTKSAAFDWAKRLAGGTADTNVVDEFIRQAAKARFGGNQQVLEALEAGLTLRQAMDPQLAEVADLLGIDPDTIELTDSKWAPLIEYKGEDGTVRPMSVSEAGVFARTRSGWETTANAKQGAAALGEEILSRMGAV